MKVFTYDAVNGCKGEQIADIQRPDALMNPDMASCVLPKSCNDTQWSVATKALDRTSHPIRFDQPVCFCLGKFTAGQDTHWQWYVLLPQD